MNKKVISWNMVIDGLRRIRVASFIYAALIVLIQFILPLLTSFGRMGHITNDVVPSLVSAEDISTILVAIPFVMVPVLTLVVFYPFNKRGASDFYHSLPYSRTCIYLSWMLSVMIVTLASILGGILLAYLSMLPFPRLFSLSLVGLGDVVFTLISASVFAAGCVALAMTVTGTWLSNIAASMLLMFLPRFIMYIIKISLANAIPILTKYFMPFFDYEYNVFTGLFCGILLNGFSGRIYTNSLVTGNIGPDIYTLVIALCLVAIGLILFNRRKSEAAGSSAQNGILQAAIRIAITFTISLVGTVLVVMDNNDISVIIVIYLIAVIAFFAYEIITTHKWKNLVKSLPTLLIVAGLNVAVFLVILISKNVILNRNIPADKIDSVRVVDIYASDSYDEYFNSAAKNIEITDEAVFKIVSDRLSETNEAIKQNSYDRIFYGITYPYAESNYKTGKLVAIKTGGSVVWRSLLFTADEMLQIVNADISQEYKDRYMQLPDPVYNTMSVILNTRAGSCLMPSANQSADLTVYKQIYDSLQSEIAEAGFEKWFRYLNYYDDMISYSKSDFSCFMSYFVNSTGNVRVRVPITHEMFPKTYAMIIQNMAGQTDYKTIDNFIKLAKESLAEADPGLHFDISMVLYQKDTDKEEQNRTLYAETWNGYNSDAENVLNILDNCLKNGKKPDENGFIMVDYNWYDEQINSSGGEGMLIPLPVNTDLILAFYLDN